MGKGLGGTHGGGKRRRRHNLGKTWRKCRGKPGGGDGERGTSIGSRGRTLGEGERVFGDAGMETGDSQVGRRPHVEAGDKPPRRAEDPV